MTVKTFVVESKWPFLIQYTKTHCKFKEDKCTHGKLKIVTCVCTQTLYIQKNATHSN